MIDFIPVLRGSVMIAVKGLYKGGDTVKIDTSSLADMHEPYEVVVTFLHPAEAPHEYAAHEANRTSDERYAGFQAFMEYQGRLSPDFDYRKELADYREERYGRTN
jgi:hypothetical protein